MCPLILSLKQQPGIDVRVCVTAQHREMLDQVLTAFRVRPDHDLNLMLAGQTLFQSTSRILAGLENVLRTERPDMVIVQGDTTTTFCGALAAFYNRTPVGHVEAGLRTGDTGEPFPEEMNRVLTTRLATLHFPPTQSAAANLYREGIPSDSVMITGNTGIDAVLYVRNALDAGQLATKVWERLDSRRKLILVTAHRRESFGPGLEQIFAALSRLGKREDLQIVYPVHPNPNVRDAANRYLHPSANVLLIDPLDYVSFVDLMRRAFLVITDSGGIQEEGPSLGKPILVLRNKTERPEAVEAGTVRLVGTDEETIVAVTVQLLTDRESYNVMARAHNPYGDGRASQRITSAIRDFFAAREFVTRAPV